MVGAVVATVAGGADVVFAAYLRPYFRGDVQFCGQVCQGAIRAVAGPCEEVVQLFGFCLVKEVCRLLQCPAQACAAKVVSPAFEQGGIEMAVECPRHGGDVLVEELSWYLALYILEGLVFVVLSLVFSSLFLFCCITVASIIVKKAKVLCAIGIYYVSKGIISFGTQIFFMFGMRSLATWLSELPDTGGGEKPILALIFLGLLLLTAVFGMLLYTLQYWMMDRKLNLS